MKKRIAAIFTAIIILMTMTTAMAMAADFKVVKTSPKDGEKGQQMDNMSVKVYFNEEVYNKKNEKNNNKACVLVDNKGKKVPTTVLFSSKEKKVAVIVANIKSTDKNYTKYIKKLTKYTLTIDDSFKSAKGNTLSKEYVTSYKTLDPSDSMKISMAMMGVLVVVMIFASKKAFSQQKKEPKKEKAEKVNPYKEAKNSGKSVEEIVARENKKKQKAALEKEEMDESEDEVIEESGNYKVKKPASIAERGSLYGKMKKKEAEAKKKAIAERKAKEEAWAKKAKKKRKK